MYFLFFFFNVVVSVYSLSDLFLDFICLYIPVWSLGKCGKERKFSFIDGKVFVFFWVVGGGGYCLT